MNAQYVETMCKMFNDTLNKYHKYGYSMMADWEVYEYKHPRYNKPVQMVLPQLVVEFPH